MSGAEKHRGKAREVLRRLVRKEHWKLVADLDLETVALLVGNPTLRERLPSLPSGPLPSEAIERARCFLELVCDDDADFSVAELRSPQVLEVIEHRVPVGWITTLLGGIRDV
ncbi:hypothetical protein C5B73_01340 [Nocardia cyriacigeorgica]|nr:hypothetical protein C5B73_01340 [Nocardia cyriacigeorgica]